MKKIVVLGLICKKTGENNDLVANNLRGVDNFAILSWWFIGLLLLIA
jgi:hypothetical protein